MQLFNVQAFVVAMAAYAINAHTWRRIIFQTHPVALHFFVKLAVMQKALALSATHEGFHVEECVFVRRCFLQRIAQQPLLANTSETSVAIRLAMCVK